MLLTLITASLFPSYVSQLCSKASPLHHKIVQSRDRTSGEIHSQTFVTMSLGLLETACFTMTDPTTQEKQSYGISLDSVKSVLEYKNSYEFGIPYIEVKCVCDCPGAEDFCSSSSNSCKENDVEEEQCINWFKEGQSNAGCTAFMSGSSEVCCSISLQVQNTTRWRAMELGSSANRAVFTFTSFDPVTTTTQELDIESGYTMSDPFDISLTAPVIASPIKNGWYFGEADSSELWGGAAVNGLSEFNINKVGWYKYMRGAYHYSKANVLSAFTARVNNCDKDDLEVVFESKYSQSKGLTDAVRLKDLHQSSISQITRNDTERKAELLFRQYGTVEITVILYNKFDVMQIFDVSFFKDFEAEILMDRHSNHFINITVIEGAGTMRGIMRTEVIEAEVFSFTLPAESPKRSNLYIRISSSCDENESAVVCLDVDTGSSYKKCKTVRCSKAPLNKFELPDSAINYEKGDKMSILSLSTWAKHLNPAEGVSGCAFVQGRGRRGKTQKRRIPTYYVV